MKSTVDGYPGRVWIMNDATRELLRNGQWRFETLFNRAIFGCVQLESGWILCSIRCCMDEDQFDPDVGKQLVKDDIVDQLVNLEAYKHSDSSAGWYKLPMLHHEF